MRRWYVSPPSASICLNITQDQATQWHSNRTVNSTHCNNILKMFLFSHVKNGKMSASYHFILSIALFWQMENEMYANKLFVHSLVHPILRKGHSRHHGEVNHPGFQEGDDWLCPVENGRKGLKHENNTLVKAAIYIFTWQTNLKMSLNNGTLKPFINQTLIINGTLKPFINQT